MIQKVIEEEEKRTIEKQCSGTELSNEELKDFKYIALGHSKGPCGECTERQLKKMQASASQVNQVQSAAQIEVDSELSTDVDTEEEDCYCQVSADYDNALF